MEQENCRLEENVRVCEGRGGGVGGGGGGEL